MNLLKRLFGAPGAATHPIGREDYFPNHSPLLLRNNNRSSQNEIVRQIHGEFETATQTIIAEANAIINKPIDRNAEIRHNLGFGQVPGDSDYAFHQKEVAASKAFIELVNKYQQIYPNYKFISELMVRRICDKYSLVRGSSELYIGDIPENNLLEIKHFQENKQIKKEDAMWGIRNNGNYGYRSIYLYSHAIQLAALNRGSGCSPEDALKDLIEPKFEICAPAKDMNTSGMNLGKDYRLTVDIKDPIVLYPVNGGFFIVSKWGIEGEDESLVNEKMN